MTPVARVMVVGRPSMPSTRSPGVSAPMVVHPVGVGMGVSKGSAFPPPAAPP